MKPGWGWGLWGQPPEEAPRATGRTHGANRPDASPMAEAPSHPSSEEQEKLLAENDAG